MYRATIIRGKFRLYIATLLSALNLLVRWGMFAGADAASLSSNSCRRISSSQPKTISQTPYVHYIGTLFGNVKVYEVPAGICKNLTTENIQLSARWMCCATSVMKIRVKQAS